MHRFICNNAVYVHSWKIVSSAYLLCMQLCCIGHYSPAAVELLFAFNVFFCILLI